MFFFYKDQDQFRQEILKFMIEELQYLLQSVTYISNNFIEF